MNNATRRDSIIILAWPETPVSAVGMWYDKIPKLLGILKDGYYKAGHAAAVLVNSQTKELKYFDFGRYHMPQKFGRVRDEKSDPHLKIPFSADLSDDNEILNINKILLWLNANKECHGKGILYASVLENVSYNRAYNFAKKMQNSDAVDYGPYDLKGSNCSRFIASLAKNSKPKRNILIRLSLPLLFTPMPKGNVIACNSEYYSVEEKEIKKNHTRFIDSFKNFILPDFLNILKLKFQFIKKQRLDQYQNAKINV